MRLHRLVCIGSLLLMFGCVDTGEGPPTPVPPPVNETPQTGDRICGEVGGNLVVPNLLGSTTREARVLLQQCDLELVVQESVGTQSYLPRGTIGAQFPRGGDAAGEDRRVTVFVSRGFFLPNLVGWDADDAERWLRDLRLSVTRDTIRDSAPVGTVVSHTPDNAVLYDSGTPVLLTVSEGLWVALPNFEGARYSDAVRELEALNLVVRHVGGTLESGFRPINACETEHWFPIVAVQTPDGGQVFEGDVIRIRTRRGSTVIFNPVPPCP